MPLLVVVVLLVAEDGLLAWDAGLLMRLEPTASVTLRDMVLLLSLSRDEDEDEDGTSSTL
jgi:hypothetical protein